MMKIRKPFTWFKTETKVITIVTAIKQKNTKSRERDVIVIFQEEPHRNWFASGIHV